jgi:putative transposase
MGLRNRSLFLDKRCFFVTTNCYLKQYLLLDEAIFEIILANFRFYNGKYKARLMAYVLMNNHIHFIVYFLEENFLSKYMRDFKKYTAKEIREYIQAKYPEILPNIIYEKRTQKFKIWNDTFDDVWIGQRKICEIKLNYIHNNPVKAGLVKSPSDYKYSSARFYEKLNPKSELLHYGEIFP